MGAALDPSPLTKARQLLAPDWVHTMRARRIAAGALVVLAAVAALRSDPGGKHRAVVVAARDLTPGVALTVDDLRLERRPSSTVPDGSQDDPAHVVGSTVAGPVRRGETLTDVRLLGSRLAGAAAGPDARIVPLHLADAALLDLVRAGDVVDILAAPNTDDTAQTTLVASDAVVVMVSAKQKGPSGVGDRVVLVALPAAAANTVAGAALVQTVTLALH